MQFLIFTLGPSALRFQGHSKMTDTIFAETYMPRSDFFRRLKKAREIWNYTLWLPPCATLLQRSQPCLNGNKPLSIRQRVFSIKAVQASRIHAHTSALGKSVHNITQMVFKITGTKQIALQMQSHALQNIQERVSSPRSLGMCFECFSSRKHPHRLQHWSSSFPLSLAHYMSPFVTSLLSARRRHATLERLFFYLWE